VLRRPLETTQIIGNLVASTGKQERVEPCSRRSRVLTSDFSASLSRKGSSLVSEIQVSDQIDIEALRERLHKMADGAGAHGEKGHQDASKFYFGSC
jgi:hypothetical protein